jgi:hypothetical protein
MSHFWFYFFSRLHIRFTLSVSPSYNTPKLNSTIDHNQPHSIYHKLLSIIIFYGWDTAAYFLLVAHTIHQIYHTHIHNNNS